MEARTTKDSAVVEEKAEAKPPSTLQDQSISGAIKPSMERGKLPSGEMTPNTLAEAPAKYVPPGRRTGSPAVNDSYRGTTQESQKYSDLRAQREMQMKRGEEI